MIFFGLGVVMFWLGVYKCMYVCICTSGCCGCIDGLLYRRHFNHYTILDAFFTFFTLAETNVTI